MRDKPSWVDRSDLKDIVAQSLTTSQVLVKLNLVPAGGNYAILHKWLKLLKIDTSHFTQKGKKMRSLSNEQVFCKDSAVSNDVVKLRMTSDLNIHYACSGCGIDKWKDQPITLELDHIDGDNTNNTVQNLRLLCPNCHSLTDTFRGRNKRQLGRSRSTGVKICACGSIIHPTSEKCRPCLLKEIGKTWPSNTDLLTMVNSSSYSEVGRKLGISSTSVRKRCLKIQKLVGPSGIAPA